MDVFDLFAKITLDQSEYESGLDSASETTKSFGSGLKSSLSTATAAIVATTAAVTAASAAIVKFVGDAAAYGDNIDKMSQKMGLSAEAYQEWDAIMQHSGTSIESLQAGMKTLANAVESGNDAFGRLGITQEQIASMNNEELFSATISALQNVESETERTYLAGQLLGRGATELGALLNTSAEDTEAMRQRVHELGGVMSDEAVKAAAAYQDSLQDMQTAISGMGRSLSEELLPVATSVMDDITEIASSDLIADVLQEASQWLSATVGGVRSLTETIDDLMPLIEGATAGFVALKAGMAIQSAIQGFQQAQVAISLLTLEVGKANLAQAALNGTMTLWETIVALVTGKITIAQLATQLWTGAQTALNGALTANPIGVVVMAVAALVAAIVAVVAWIRKLKKETDEAAEAIEELSQEVDEATQSMSAALQVEEDSASALEELRDQTLALSSANDTLSDALKEQKENGSLSLDTALDLIDAGYAAAIAIDEETGAVTLNQEAYIDLAAAKIDDQIASLEIQRQSEINAQKLEQEEINVRATGSAYWEAAAAKAAASSSDDVTMLDAQIAALKRAKESLGSYTTTTKTTSKSVKTQAEKDLATYKSLKSQLDHEKNMELVSEKDYYQNLATLRDNYLTDDSNLAEYQKINEQIHKHNKNLVDSISDSWEKISSLEETYQKELQSRAQEIFNSYKLFDKIPERQKVSGQELIANLQDQVSNIQEFYDNLAALSERGVGEALVEDIRSMGPSAIDQLAALLDLSDDKLNEYAELYGEKQELANRYAAEGLTSLREETDEKILESLNSMESIYDEQVPEIGASFIDGLADAIMEGMQNVVGSATSVAQAAVDAVQRTLGGGLKTASVNFSDSAVGKSSAATVNAITSVATEHQADFSLNATLVAPDGTKFANYYLPSFIKQAAANGTPIAGQQYA